MTDKTDRDERGRFLPGNPGGPGRPPNTREHRAAMVQAVTPKDIAAIMQALVDRAKAGDVQAAKIVLERFFGRPADGDLLERVEALEVMADEKAA